MAFMNIAELLTFIVPKSAYCWPLIASSTAGAWITLSPVSAPITVA